MAVEFASSDHRHRPPALLMRAKEAWSRLPTHQRAGSSCRLESGMFTVRDRQGKLLLREIADEAAAKRHREVELRGRLASAKARMLLAHSPSTPQARRSDLRSLYAAVADLQASVAYWGSFQPTDPRPPRR